MAALACGVGRQARAGGRRARDPAYAAGWEAALREIEHQAEHWATPDHRELGVLIAEALRSAVTIARGGGLACDHRPAANE